MAKRILLIVVILLLVIQFFRPDKNIHPGPQPNAIANAYYLPANVASLLEKACNDCHSNNTRYPWYNRVQPVAWYLQHHLNEGKHELNFDEFLTYPPKKQDHKLKEVVDQVKKGEMPLTSYTLIHTDARLTEVEKQLIINWADSLRNQINKKI